MKRIYIMVISIAVSVLLNACQQKQEEKEGGERLTLSGAEVAGPYLTEDHRGNPVLCWMEKEESDSLYHLEYAVYDVSSHQFNAPVIVRGTEGSSLTAESMSKIAFKDDGTVIAVFAKSFIGEENKYAGAIYYSTSNDNGDNWSEPRYLHSDTLHTYSRSFFDVAKLADGEIGAVWLDGRFAKGEEGSALFFAKTEKGKGFGQDICLDKNTCECCRTEILSGDNGQIHIAYRGIQFPSGKLGKQVRDMVYCSSSDMGKTFTSPMVLNEDHWEIEGCPHTGPTLASNKNEVDAVWFTGGGIPGLYFSRLGAASEHFSKGTLITEVGRHPQMVGIDDRNAVVWTESTTVENAQQMEQAEQGHEGRTMSHDNMSMSHGGMSMNHVGASSSQIILAFLDRDGKVGKQTPISTKSESADLAVIAPVDKGLVMAWVQRTPEGSGIYYSYRSVD